MGFRIRDGDVTVTLDDGLERLARAALDEVIPGVVRRMESDVGGILDDAASEWPIETGRSRAGLARQTTLLLGGEGVEVLIADPVPYVPFIKPRKLHGATTAWQRYVRGPMAALHRELTITLGPVIVDALTKGR